MNEAKIREDFEKYYLGGNKHMGRRNEHGDYVWEWIQDAWGGWRAAYELTHAEFDAWIAGLNEIFAKEISA